MSNEQYDLVFKGELVKGVELEQARRNLGALFKLDGPKLNAMFSGKSITIKKKLDFDTASKYRTAIKKAGALVELVEINSTVSSSSKGKAVFTVGGSPSESVEEKKSSRENDVNSRIAEELKANPSSEKPNEKLSEKATSDSLFSLAPVGAELLSANEVSEEPKAHIDLSGLSLKEADGPLVSDHEVKKEATQKVKVDDSMSILDTQGYLVRDNERQIVEPVHFDTSSISLAEPGVRIVEEKHESVAEIDTSALRVEQH